jgi:hypothetical protein
MGYSDNRLPQRMFGTSLDGVLQNPYDSGTKVQTSMHLVIHLLT